MRAVGWPETPLLLPDSHIGFHVVSASRPRKLVASRPDGEQIQHSRLSADDSSIGLLSTPKISEWGTVFALLKTPSLTMGATPVAQRGGATLWLSPHPQASSVGHAVEWVDPHEWLLIASHVTTERVWWDVLGWGTGAGSTVDAPNGTDLHDNGLTFIASHEPLVIATLQFHGRTFGHDELMGFADSKTLPSEPSKVWLPSRPSLSDSLSILGSIEPAHSWDASSTRARKRAVQIIPTRGHSWRSEVKVPAGTVELQLGTNGDGFVMNATTPVLAQHEPIRSLMNTPFPNDDSTD
jgi:hypothetical protein